MSSDIPDTQQKILDATWRLLKQGSGAGVRMSDIATEAGVSRQAVYLHFNSRTELMVAVARYGDEMLEMEDRLQAAEAAESGVARLDAFVAFWGNYIPDIYGCAKALIVAREDDEAAAAAWDDRMDAVREFCQSVIEALKRDALLASEWTPEQATDLLCMVLSISNWEELTRERGWSTNEYVDRMQTLLKRVLIRDGA